MKNITTIERIAMQKTAIKKTAMEKTAIAKINSKNNNNCLAVFFGIFACSYSFYGRNILHNCFFYGWFFKDC